MRLLSLYLAFDGKAEGRRGQLHDAAGLSVVLCALRTVAFHRRARPGRSSVAIVARSGRHGSRHETPYVLFGS